MMARLNISFVGAGRVANALCRQLYSSGHKIGLIVSETEKNGKILADYCKTSWSRDLIFPELTDIIFVAVPDQKLKSVLDTLKCGSETLVVHTAGSIGIEVFPKHLKRKGIFYPLQTFSPKRKVIFTNVPIFLESSDRFSSVIMERLAESIGGKVYLANSEQRRMMHVAAVFASNFTNLMLTVSKELTLKSDFPFEVMKPLIEETIYKAMDIGPENSQTGPAIRNDQNTIEKHLELLSFSPELKRLYFEITRAITEYYKKKI